MGALMYEPTQNTYEEVEQVSQENYQGEQQETDVGDVLGKRIDATGDVASDDGGTGDAS